MKQALLFFFFSMMTASMCSQTTERIEISGKIIATENDIESVTVYNASSNKGTITNNKGAFKIAVALNDRIEISALQFKLITIVIDKDIIKSKKLAVFLTEQVNNLDEVLILPSGLTGSLEVDVDSVQLIKPLMMNFGDIKNYEFPIDHLTKVDNTLVKQGQLYNGINFAEILGINKWLNKKKKRPTHEEMLAEETKKSYDLSDKYSPTYISTNFNIPTNRIQAFYAYLYANEFDRVLLNEDKELDLIEFLVQKSKLFLKEKDDKE